MAYKIAVASSDQININQTFGSALQFLIYEVDDTGNYSLVGRRQETKNASSCASIGGTGCGSGCQSGGCGSGGDEIPKVTLLSDCRCIICKKIGFKVQKQLEKKAITSFDVECKIEEALHKITLYFKRVDDHETLRGIARKGE